MLNNQLSHPITSSMTVQRMRYRGPMESYKLNKFATDSAKDISVLEAHFRTCHDDLKEYINETLTECSTEMIIGKGGAEVFKGTCSANIDKLCNQKDNNLKFSKGVK